MRHLAFLFVLTFLLYSCESSEPEVEDTNVVVVDETATDEDSEEETEEESEEEESEEGETDEDDRWANYVHSSITIEPYYYPNSEIASSTDANGSLIADIIEGDRLVFHYYEDAGEKVDTITGERLADSGYLIEFLFAIDADKTEFKLMKENFSAALAQYKLKSNYPAQGYYNVTDGIIEGEKISDTEWKITANIIWTIPADEDHEDIHHDFELSSNFIPEPEE